MIRATALVLILSCAAAASADDEGQKPAAPPVPAKKEGDAAAPAEAQAPVRGVRYKITLRTGRSLIGIVTNERVFERRNGISWNNSEKDSAGAGIRLYFPKGLEGFVFLPMKDVKSAEKLGDVTDQEGRDLADQRAAGAKRANDERERLRRERIAREEAQKAKAIEEADQTKTAEGAPKVPGSPAGGSGASPEEQLGRYTALLTKYPPGRWTPETPKEIERRRIVMDLPASDEEKTFLAVFDEWSKAYAVWKSGQDKPATPGTAATK